MAHNGHPGQPTGGTLRLQPNVPAEVALKFRDGREVEGAYGPQVMFTLVDGRKIYLNPGPAERIRELGLRPGEFFTICKRQTNGNSVRWEVTRLDPPAANGNGHARREHAAPPAPAYASNLERQLANSIEHVASRKANGHANGHANGNGAAASALAPAVSLHGAAMTAALRVSIDALAEARSYAKRRHGVEVDFTSEDIRTVAATLFIQVQRERGL